MPKPSALLTQPQLLQPTPPSTAAPSVRRHARPHSAGAATALAAVRQSARPSTAKAIAAVRQLQPPKEEEEEDLSWLKEKVEAERTLRMTADHARFAAEELSEDSNLQTFVQTRQSSFPAVGDGVEAAHCFPRDGERPNRTQRDSGAGFDRSRIPQNLVARQPSLVTQQVEQRSRERNAGIAARNAAQRQQQNRRSPPSGQARQSTTNNKK